MAKEKKDSFYLYENARMAAQQETQKERQQRTEKIGRNADPEELYLVGVRYARGYNAEKDVKRAAEYFLMAAELDYVPAQFKLAHAYERGRGVSQDFQEAAYWFRKAAENGHVAAQCHLGLLFAKGRGVTRDNKEAVYWYRKAAEKGNSAAQNNIALMYEYGFGVEKNFSEAVRWYKMAAVKGNASAETALERLNIKSKPFLKRLWNSINPSHSKEDNSPLSEPDEYEEVDKNK